jgi:hypothetical protein
MSMPNFEYNEFDKDGNWIEGPLHPDPGHPVEPGATAAPDEEEASGDSSDAESGGDVFDPGEHTVEEVIDYVEDNPDERDRVIKAEQDGKRRSTLLASLAE